MKNIQEQLEKIQNNWGKIPEHSLSQVALRKKVYVYKLILVEELNSSSEAIEKYGSSCETGLRDGFPQGEYFFSYGSKGKRARKPTTKSKTIKVFHNGVEVGQYNKVTDAAKELNIHRTCIQHTLSGRYPSYRGYTFKYV